ncbi:tRNA (adenosine(37)-N6)-dimethylallyltransferase MiaA [Pseudochryseolinea flava]|uniref:tRNA dimethylallyltransferase n=2 Tax=Pseudochryseolinea flava TaxID=2059302 RepID=A0A364XYK9_9BACT|nr:tRNA (adenosine(37)-N6)-dimethylallyltransferase MiaA [Pseudochryseolinea flava]
MVAKSKKLVVVAGPTAVGKTATAIRIAQHFYTEIISADSRQIFKELTIGTAKPDEVELAAVPHHFINSHTISQQYDAATFATEALAVIQNLFLKNDHVILCGGSGLYIKALCDGFDDIPAVDENIRKGLVSKFEALGIEWLQHEMERLDPEHYKTLDKLNPHRLIRALEIKIGTGNSIASYRTNSKRKHDFDIVKIGLTLPREVLYERIDLRMDKMIEAGLFQEAKEMLPFEQHQALQTVGYQEIFGYFHGAYDKEEAIRLLKRNSRHYAKRQLTWFKRDEEFKWFQPTQLDDILHHINSYK